MLEQFLLRTKDSVNITFSLVNRVNISLYQLRGDISARKKETKKKKLLKPAEVNCFRGLKDTFQPGNQPYLLG